MNDKYKDMLTMPHPVSTSHPRMPLSDRAAQFSPFAALTGYEDALRETARLTEHFVDLDEDSKQEIDRSIRYLQDHIKEKPWVTICYFVADARKEGGSYCNAEGEVYKIDIYQREIIMKDNTVIPIDNINNMIINDVLSETGN